MEKFIIKRCPLSGQTSGNKTPLCLLAACTLTDEPVVLQCARNQVRPAIAARSSGVEIETIGTIPGASMQAGSSSGSGSRPQRRIRADFWPAR
jgi:hypothetical protein